MEIHSVARVISHDLMKCGAWMCLNAQAQELLQMLRAQYLMQLLETAVESEDVGRAT